MSSKRAERHGRDWILSGLLIALAWVLAPTPATATPRNSHPANQDEACLACHGTAGMKSGSGKDISINASKHAASAHAVLGCQDCHTAIKDFPHPAKVAKVQCATCHDQEAKNFLTSAHSLLGDSACASCHGSVHELTTTETLAPAKCKECHADEVKEFADSIHGQAAKNGDKDAPKCVSCHGAIHQVKLRASRVPRSPAKTWRTPVPSATVMPGFCHAIRFLSLIPSSHTNRAYTAASWLQEMKKRLTATVATEITISIRRGTNALA